MEDPHKEFLLDRLRVACLRCKVMENELASIGVALRHDMIGPAMAVKWVHDLGGEFLIEPLPSALVALALGNISPEAGK